MGRYVTTAQQACRHHQHLRPILSESEPNKVKKGMAIRRAMATMIEAVLTFHFQNCLQIE